MKPHGLSNTLVEPVTIAPLFPTQQISLQKLKLINHPSPLVKSVYPKNIFLFLNENIYVAGTQKNGLKEKVLLSTQNIC